MHIVIYWKRFLVLCQLSLFYTLAVCFTKPSLVHMNRQVVTWNSVVPTGGTEQRTYSDWRCRYRQTKPTTPSTEVVNHSTGPCSVCRNSSIQFRSFLPTQRRRDLDRLEEKSHWKCGKWLALNVFSWGKIFLLGLLFIDVIMAFQNPVLSDKFQVKIMLALLHRWQRMLCGL